MSSFLIAKKRHKRHLSSLCPTYVQARILCPVLCPRLLYVQSYVQLLLYVKSYVQIKQFYVQLL